MMTRYWILDIEEVIIEEIVATTTEDVIETLDIKELEI